MKTIKKCTFFFYCCLSIVFLTACASLQPVVIEVREPAAITLPLDIAEIVVIDNSAPQPVGTGISQSYDDIALSDNSLNTNKGTIVVQALYKTLLNSGFFNDISYSHTSIRTYGDWLQEHAPIPLAIQKGLMDTLSFDGILSVDRVLFSVVENVKNNMPGKHSSKSHYVDMKIEAQANGSIYIYNQEKPFHSFTVMDSIIIKDTYFEDSLTVVKNLPETAINDLARNLGNKLAHVILPSWVPKERYIYTGTSARMKEAYSYVRNNNWEMAREIWINEYKLQTKAINKGKMANNIAIAYEIEDNLNESLHWANITQESFIQANMKSGSEMMVRTRNYVEELKKRIEDNRLLSKQIGL